MKQNKAEKVRDELVKKTEVKPQGKKEEDNAFRIRVAYAVNELSKAQYAKLSPEAQAWYVKAVEHADTGELPPFAPVLKIGLKEEGGMIRIGKPKLPTWDELKAMEDADVDQLAKKNGVDLDGQTFTSYDQALRYIADELKIERPATISIGARQEKIDQAKGKPSYQKIMQMTEKQIDRLADDFDIDLTSSKAPTFDGLQEAREYVAKKLGVKPGEGVLSHTGTKVEVKVAEKGDGMNRAKYMLKSTAERHMRNAASTISRSIGKLLPAKYREPVRTVVKSALGLEE